MKGAGSRRREGSRRAAAERDASSSLYRSLYCIVLYRSTAAAPLARPRVVLDDDLPLTAALAELMKPRGETAAGIGATRAASASTAAAAAASAPRGQHRRSRVLDLRYHRRRPAVVRLRGHEH